MWIYIYNIYICACIPAVSFRRFAPWGWSWSWGHGKSTSHGHCSECGKPFTRHSSAVIFIISLCEAAQGRNPHDPVQIKAAEADGTSMDQQLHHNPRAHSPKHGKTGAADLWFMRGGLPEGHQPFTSNNEWMYSDGLFFFFFWPVTKSTVHRRVCVKLRPACWHTFNSTESLIVSPQWRVITDPAIWKSIRCSWHSFQLNGRVQRGGGCGGTADESMLA